MGEKVKTNEIIGTGNDNSEETKKKLETSQNISSRSSDYLKAQTTNKQTEVSTDNSKETLEEVESSSDTKNLAEMMKKSKEYAKISEIMSVIEDNQKEPPLDKKDFEDKLVKLLASFPDVSTENKKNLLNEIIENGDLLDEETLKQKIQEIRKNQEEEKERQVNEQERQVNEQERQVNEQERQVNEQERQVNEKEKQVNEKELYNRKQTKEQANQIIESFSSEELKSNPNFSNILEKVGNLEEILKNKEDNSKYENLNRELEEILNLLKNPGVLDKIFSSLDEKQANKFYSTISHIATERGDTELLNKLDTAWIGRTGRLGVPPNTPIQTNLDGSYQSTHNGLTTKIKDGNQKIISLNKPGSCEIPVGETTNFDKQLDEISNKYNPEIINLNQSINTISSLLKYVKDAISNNTDIEEVKANLQKFAPELYKRLNLGSISDLNRIQEILNNTYNKTKEDLEKLEQEKEAELKRLNIETYERERYLRDTQKAGLDIFHQLFIDIFGTDFLMRFIELINSGRLAHFGLQKVEIQNGKTGLENGFGKIDATKFSNMLKVVNIGFFGNDWDENWGLKQLDGNFKTSFKDETGKIILDNSKITEILKSKQTIGEDMFQKFQYNLETYKPKGKQEENIPIIAS